MQFLRGLSFESFRSFSDEEQLVGPFSKLNVFIGKNNSGKSNVLRYIGKVSKHFLGLDGFAPFNDYDHPRGGAGVTTTCKILIDCNDKALETLGLEGSGEKELVSRVLRIASGIEDSPDQMVWLPIRKGERDRINLDKTKLKVDEAIRSPDVDQRKLQIIWARLTQQGGGSATQHWIPEITERLFLRTRPQMTIQYISTFRKLGTQIDEYKIEYGSGGDTEIHSQLAALERPPHDQMEDQERFFAIQDFMRDVVGDPSLTIQVPSNQKTVNVSLDGRVIPIESLGAGIFQIFYLAAKCVVLKNHIILLEEPELHLHPDQQRKLVSFLDKRTENQYFISTHSSHFIDAVNAEVFEVQKSEGKSWVRSAAKAADRVALNRSLGYLPSDLLQANAIIWVEGPSDRVYIKRWISDVSPDLREGVEFSILFYGGGLLRHLSADESRTSELIHMLTINRHSSIMIDSDKRNRSIPIGETKKRVQREIIEAGGVCWITKGRTIENYIGEESRLNAIRAVHPRSNAQKLAYPGDIYGPPLHFIDKHGTIRGSDFSIDKVAISQVVVNEEAVDLTQLDLRVRVEEMVRFVREANNLPCL